MKLIEFFDPSNPEHLRWFNQSEGDWPKEAQIVFLQYNIERKNMFEEGLMIMSKIANYYMKTQLGESFICPPAFKEVF